MPILAVDTCLGAVSAALCWRDAAGAVQCASRYEPCRGGHAERLLPMVAEILAEGRIGARQVRRIAVTLGPGTFTGVRTGIAFARAFALGTDAAVVGTSSLAVVAAGLAPCNVATAVAFDARKGDVFLQLFAANGMAQSAPELLPLSAAVERLRGASWQVAGSAAVVVAAAASARGITIKRVIGDCEPDARHLALMADALPPLPTVTPLYLRPPDALPQAGKSVPRVSS